MDALFSAVRRACPTPKWNYGSQLVRGQAVSLESRDEEELVLRVQVGAQGDAPAVRLYPEDEEWDCDCQSPHGACEHVAAAVIALREAKRAGKELPRLGAQKFRLHYAFYRCEPTLKVQRFLEREGYARQKLEHAVADLARKKVRQPDVLVTKADLAAERILTPPKRGALPAETLAALFRVLGESMVTLDDKVVQVSERRVLPSARVYNHKKEGFVLRFVADPKVSEVVGAGFVLCGDRLQPLGELKLSGMHMERLPFARWFRGDDIAKLVQKTLPALQKRIRVNIDTDELPSISRTLSPELRFVISRRGDTLDILPEIVYGDPPCARVEQKELVHLRAALPRRDEEGEVEAALYLKDRFNLVPNRHVYLHGQEGATFVEQLQAFPGRIEGFDPRPASQGQGQGQKPLQPRISTTEHTWALDFVLPREGKGQSSEDLPRARPEDVLAAWRAGHTQVALEGGGFAPLPRAWLNEQGSRLEALFETSSGPSSALSSVLASPEQAKQRPIQALSALQRLELSALCQKLDEVPAPQLSRLLPLLGEVSKIPPATLPQDLCATLRDYQKQGVDWLIFLRELQLGALLADDMGLGKTLQTLCALKGKSLVVCPTSVIFNWEREAQKFRPGLRVQIYHGAKRALDPEADVCITSYALLRLDQDKLGAQAWDCVVLDEAHTIKNPQSQVSRAAFSLSAPFKVALTGTPVENRLEELWSIMHFCNPGLLRGRTQFQRDFAEPIARGDQKAAQRLQQKIMPLSMRRKKSEVAQDLPPRSDSILFCELSPPERQIYAGVLSKTRAELSPELGLGSGDQDPPQPLNKTLSILERLLRLRQAACHSALLPQSQSSASAKVELLLARLQELLPRGHRALVFSQWTSLLDLVQAALEAQDIAWSRIDGRTSDRGRVVESFQSGEGAAVMLLSLKAGGTGLNLTAADHVFILDPWWNPAAEAQAADRAYRIGQDKPVFVYRIVAKDTVEEKILRLQEHKRRLADTAMQGAAVDPSLTRAELIALIQD